MADQANIWTKLGFDGRGFEAGLLRAEKGVRRFARQAGQYLAGLFTVRALTNAAKQLFIMADRIKTMSQQSQITTDQFQKMAYAAAKTGIRIEDITSSIKGLAMARERALQGKAGNLDEFYFGQAGISKEQLAGMTDPYEAFIRTLSGMRNLSGLDRLKAAQQLMTETGVKVLPLLNAELGLLIKRFDELGLGISSDNIDKLADFKTGFADITTFISSTASPAMAKLADDINKVFDAATRSTSGGGANKFGEALEKIYSWIPGTPFFLGNIAGRIMGGGPAKHEATIKKYLGRFPILSFQAHALDKFIFGGKSRGMRQYSEPIGPQLPIPGVQYPSPIGPEWPFAAGKDKTKKKLAQSVFSPSTDALARIGGFVGRGAPAVNYAKLQLDVQKKIQRDTKRTADALGPGI